MKRFVDFQGQNLTGGAPFQNEDFYSTDSELYDAINPTIQNLGKQITQDGNFVVSGMDITPNGSDWDVAPGIVSLGGELYRFQGVTAISSGVNYIVVGADVVTSRNYKSGGSKAFFIEKVSEHSTSTSGGDEIEFDPSFVSPFKRFTSNYQNLLYDNIQLFFEQVGQGTSIPAITAPVISALDTESVAYLDVTNESLRKYKLVGGVWTLQGNSLSITSVALAKITSLSSNRIAYVDVGNAELRVYDFDGTDWAQVGNGFSLAGIEEPAITTLSSNRIAIVYDLNSDNVFDLVTYDFDGTDWVQVGNNKAIATVSNPSITAMTSNRIAYVDDTNQKLRAYDFDGTDWIEVGTGLTISGLQSTSIAALSTKRVCLVDDRNADTTFVVRFYDFNETGWTLGLSSSNIFNVSTPSITARNNHSIIYIDGTNEELRVYEHLLDKSNVPNIAF